MVGGPVLIDHATEVQRNRWLLALAAGRESWCQLFSEPGAGSDLAGLALRATPCQGGWRLTGQKLWSREAVGADRGLVLARTDLDVPKHLGISCFVVDIDQPGVDVRPIRQMNNRSTFNEVFLTDVFVPVENLIGALGQGWPLARASLSHERQEVGGGGVLRPAKGVQPGRRNGMLDVPVAELVARHRAEERANPVTRGTRTPEAMIALARRSERAGDPVVRQRLMEMHALSEARRLTMARARAAPRTARRPPLEASAGKLIGSELGRHARDLALDLQGAAGMLAGVDAPDGGIHQQMVLTVPSLSIAGGTDEIQRNLIGERVLGLPREPDPDRDVPFRRTATATPPP